MFKRSKLVLVGLFSVCLILLAGCQGTNQEKPNYLTGQSSPRVTGGSNSRMDTAAAAIKLKQPAYGQR